LAARRWAAAPNEPRAEVEVESKIHPPAVHRAAVAEAGAAEPMAAPNVGAEAVAAEEPRRGETEAAAAMDSAEEAGAETVFFRRIRRWLP